MAEEELVFSSPRVRIGRFERHPSAPDFADTGPTGGALLVFPRLAVRIAQAGRRAVVADPTVVMLYNRGQEYSRAAISPEGDRCDWFGFEPEDIAGALGEPRFSEPRVPAAPRLVARARALFAHARATGSHSGCGSRSSPRLGSNSGSISGAGSSSGTSSGSRGGPEPLFVEEQALLLLRALFPAPANAAVRASWLRLTDAAQELLALRFAEPLLLSHLSAALGCSPFQLCRAFRAATGRTVHQHLTALRLHAALEQLPERGRDLAALALELGFSHHAHLSAAFRRAYGLTPSAWIRARS